MKEKTTPLIALLLSIRAERIFAKACADHGIFDLESLTPTTAARIRETVSEIRGCGKITLAEIEEFGLKPSRWEEAIKDYPTWPANDPANQLRQNEPNKNVKQAIDLLISKGYKIEKSST